MTVQVTLTSAAGTFQLHPPQWRVRNHLDVYRVGGSVGTSLRVAKAHGSLPRERRRGELPVTLRDVFVNGRVDSAGTVVADPEANLRMLLRTLTVFLEEDRDVALTVVDGGLTLSADAQFEEMSAIAHYGSDLAEFDLLFMVPGGRFTEVTPVAP